MSYENVKMGTPSIFPIFWNLTSGSLYGTSIWPFWFPKRGTSYAFPNFLEESWRNRGTPCTVNKSPYFLSSSLLIPACLRISSSVPFGRIFPMKRHNHSFPCRWVDIELMASLAPVQNKTFLFKQLDDCYITKQDDFIS